MRKSTAQRTSPPPDFDDHFKELSDLDFEMVPAPHLQTIFDAVDEIEKMSARLVALHGQVQHINDLNSIGINGLLYASKKVSNAARDLLVGYQPPDPNVSSNK